MSLTYFLGSCARYFGPVLSGRMPEHFTTALNVSNVTAYQIAVIIVPLTLIHYRKIWILTLSVTVVMTLMIPIIPISLKPAAIIDVNADLTINIFDVMNIISYLYTSGPPPVPLE
jgi:hypothetical protein